MCSYDEEPKPAPASAAAAKPAPDAAPDAVPAPAIARSEPVEAPEKDADMADQGKMEQSYGDAGPDANGDSSWQQQQGNVTNSQGGDDGYGMINVKEDG